MTSVDQRPICNAVRADGQPCRARASIHGRCVGHAPSSAEARRRGGLGSSKQARLGRRLPHRLRGILDVIEVALQEVHDGVISPSQAMAISALASAACRVLETGELESKLQRLEELAEQQQPVGGRWN